MTKQERLEALGHRLEVRPTVSGRRFIVRCSCGYGAATKNGQPTVTRATMTEAARTAAWHARKMLDEDEQNARVNGGRRHQIDGFDLHTADGRRWSEDGPKSRRVG